MSIKKLESEIIAKYNKYNLAAIGSSLESFIWSCYENAASKGQHHKADLLLTLYNEYINS